MSTPHSAIKTRAVLTLTPGVVKISSTNSAWSSQALPMRASRVATARSSASMWASAGDEVGQRLAQLGIFVRSLALASSASRQGLAGARTVTFG